MRNAWVLIAALFLGMPSARADHQVAVVGIAGDKASQMRDSIVGIVGDTTWKAVAVDEVPAGVAAVVKGQLVKRKGHSAHLLLKVHKGVDGAVVADIDLRVGRKGKLDTKKRNKLAKQLGAALDTIETELASQQPKPAPRPTRPAVQAHDDELPPGFRR